MTERKCRLLGMGLPCCLAFLIDTTLAFWDQPSEYWHGQYSQTVEDTLFFRTLYEIHPLAAVAGYAAWAAVIAGLLLLLPEVLAVILAIAVVFGHVLGAYTQIIPILGRGWYQVANAMFLAAAAALGIGLYWSLRTAPADGGVGGEQRLPLWLRWGLIAGLLATGCFMLWSPWRG
jgi:hypothetical protein